ncbi:MAG: hypothetical protein KGH98_03730 [Candidatus Micrarchaeota archaeon]|nr:hypothetical protein [Candidatus Micrarchaeota archaeon]
MSEKRAIPPGFKETNRGRSAGIYSLTEPIAKDVVDMALAGVDLQKLIGEFARTERRRNEELAVVRRIQLAIVDELEGMLGKYGPEIVKEFVVRGEIKRMRQLDARISRIMSDCNRGREEKDWFVSDEQEIMDAKLVILSALQNFEPGTIRKNLNAEVGRISDPEMPAEQKLKMIAIQAIHYIDDNMKVYVRKGESEEAPQGLMDIADAVLAVATPETIKADGNLGEQTKVLYQNVLGIYTKYGAAETREMFGLHDM